MDILFADGELHQGLPLTGDERHAFLRATKNKEMSLPPLLKTVATQAVLKNALWHKGLPYYDKANSKVEAPLFIIPDVQVCNAFTSAQAGSLGGSAIVVAADHDILGSIFFTENASGHPDSMFVPITSNYGYEPAENASGVSFVRTSVRPKVCITPM